MNNSRKLLFLLAFIMPLFFLASCEKDDGSIDDVENDNDGSFSLGHYYSGISTLELEVAYEAGAEPYTVNTTLLGSSNIWSLTKANIEALFKTRPIETVVNVPLELAGMQEIPKQKQGDYTKNDIKSIGDQYRIGKNKDDVGNIFIVFVDAYFSLNGERQEQVLGVAIGNTPYVAIFKPVINSISAGDGTKKSVEQATVIHETGHALGLVDFGLPMSSEHKDEDHGAHCDNEDCIMFWEVASKSAASSFMSFLQDSETILFGPECLSDSRTYQP